MFLSVCDDAWSGLSNKASVDATDQIINGNVLVGSDSTATLKLTGSSAWTGMTSGSITSHKNSSSVSSSIGTVSVTLGSSSVWNLTGNSTVSSISGSGTVNYNGYSLTVNGTKYTSGNIGSVTGKSGTAATKTETSDSGNSTTGTYISKKPASVKAKAKKNKVTVSWKKIRKTNLEGTCWPGSGRLRYRFRLTKTSGRLLQIRRWKDKDEAHSETQEEKDVLCSRPIRR